MQVDHPDPPVILLLLTSSSQRTAVNYYEHRHPQRRLYLQWPLRDLKSPIEYRQSVH